MRRRLITAALIVTALGASGGAAFAIAGAVSTSPAPLYISRTSPDGFADHPDTTAERRSMVTLSTTDGTSATTSTTVASRVSTSTTTPTTEVRPAVTSSGASPGLPDDRRDRRGDDHGGSDDSGFDDNGGHGSDDNGFDDQALTRRDLRPTVDMLENQLGAVGGAS